MGRQWRSLLVALAAFLATSLALFAASASPEGLELAVRLTKGCPEAVCPFGSPVELQLMVSNLGSTSEGILLQDHDGNGHRREVPTGLQGRLLKDGDVLSQHSVAVFDPEDAEWFSSLMFESTYCIDDVEELLSGPESRGTLQCEQPGDRVVLEPSESVVRVVALGTLLRGAPGVDLPLEPGRYSIELRLGALKSKAIEFLVEPP
ncbi:MAG: hypothetical protein K8J08_11785 [Thermoanaerobaculia bacterium]|nr:hypothetical protein [Thermoanaerobaculia bacterium]